MVVSRMHTPQQEVRPGIARETMSRTRKVRKLSGNSDPQYANPTAAAIGTGSCDITSPAPVRSWNFGLVAAVCVFLVLAVAIVFGQTLWHGFVNFDDDVYVYAAPRIVQGLACRSVAWAFTHSHAGNWHPLTSISHMLDCQMYGLRPAGHHLTNLVFHAAAAVLLFLVLRSLTGELWLSAFVAAVFAVHPLRAESVAWVAERKAVLSGLFFMLTIVAYTWYARRRFSLARYVAVVMLFALGLMCKPSLVTLPFLLLLLDYWPLGRFAPPPGAESGQHPGERSGRHRILARLVVEKLPLVAFTVPICVTVLRMQRVGLQPLAVLSPTARVANALVSYAAYLGQFFYPVNLVAFYPHPGNAMPIWKPAGAALVLLAISIAALAWRRTHPYLLIGWLWYLMTLVPVIGLVQVGHQQMADRYTYRSEIGISIALAWGIADLSRSWPWRRRVLGCTAVLVIASLMGIAWRQTSYWRDSTTLWTHALKCNTRNYMAHLDLGNAAIECGQIDEAICCYRRALEIKPDYALAHCNLGQTLLTRGREEEAVQHFQKALELDPELADADYNLGNVMVQRKQLGQAIAYYRKALQINPDFALAHNNLGAALADLGKLDEAIEHYRQALEISPQYADSYHNLGCALYRRGRVDDAVAEWRKTLQVNPAYVQAHFYLGQISLQQRKYDEAIDHFREALRINPHITIATQYLALALSQQRQTVSATAAHGRPRGSSG
jgi:tetratricopeptide (TPR) repeat protein